MMIYRFKIDSSGRVMIGRASAYGSTDADNLIVGDEAVNEHQGINTQIVQVENMVVYILVWSMAQTN